MRSEHTGGACPLTHCQRPGAGMSLRCAGRLLLTLASVGCLVVLTACGMRDGQGSPAAGDPNAGRGELFVSAASSLTEVFTTLGDEFAGEHGSELQLNFDSSSGLASQIIEGAPADVFAAADEVAMDELVREGLVEGTPIVFARNQLVIVTEPGNPEGIDELADLGDVEVLSLCGEQAPCGRLAAEVLDRAGVEIQEQHVTRAQNAKGALAAVADGDAGAGLVYATDAMAAGDAVTLVEIPAPSNAISDYTIAVLVSSDEPDRAHAFVELVLSAQGQDRLTGAGFLPPT